MKYAGVFLLILLLTACASNPSSLGVSIETPGPAGMVAAGYDQMTREAAQKTQMAEDAELEFLRATQTSESQAATATQAIQAPTQTQGAVIEAALTATQAATSTQGAAQATQNAALTATAQAQDFQHRAFSKYAWTILWLIFGAVAMLITGWIVVSIARISLQKASIVRDSAGNPSLKISADRHGVTLVDLGSNAAPLVRMAYNGDASFPDLGPLEGYQTEAMQSAGLTKLVATLAKTGQLSDGMIERLIENAVQNALRQSETSDFSHTPGPNAPQNAVEPGLVRLLPADDPLVAAWVHQATAHYVLKDL